MSVHEVGSDKRREDLDEQCEATSTFGLKRLIDGGRFNSPLVEEKGIEAG